MGDLNSSLYIPLYTFLSRFRSVYHNNMKLTLLDGYFICPSTQTNRALAGQKNGIILNDLSVYSIYKKKFGPQVRALEHFLELNGMRLEEDNNIQFATYMALLTYLIAFYKRRLDFVDINSIDIKWEVISHFITVDNVDRMYNGIILAIAKKGLSQRTAREIAFGKLQDPRAALENVLNLLNSMELPYHVADQKKQVEYLKRRLVTDIEEFRTRNPLSTLIGHEMEVILEKRLTAIKNLLTSKFGADKGIIISLNRGGDMTHYVHEQYLKIPDFLYVDSKLNMLALDSKCELFFAEPVQISRQNLGCFMETIKLKEKLKQMNPPINISL